MIAVTAFLLAFPSLFSIINPIGGALIFNSVTRDFAPADKLLLAQRIGIYALLVMLGALWGGAYVLNFFGVTLGALRIAGGAVVALSAWDLLMTRDRHEEGRHREGEAAAQTDSSPLDVAFFPLTMPLTTGPGTIAVAITLGAERPASGIGLIAFFLGVSVAAGVNAALVWIAYRSAERLNGWLGTSARTVVAPLMAFLLLCIGVQILVTGVGDMVAGWHA